MVGINSGISRFRVTNVISRFRITLVPRAPFARGDAEAERRVRLEGEEGAALDLVGDDGVSAVVVGGDSVVSVVAIV